MTFTDTDLQRLRRETFVASVEHHRRTNSTNDLAMTVALQDDAQLPWLAIADEQTAGRGRGGNQWWGGPGALMFSLALDTTTMSIPNSAWPRASLTCGLAVCRALQLLDESIVFRLKWPNDVFANDKKISGILIEVPPAQQQRIVIGIGVNVANSFSNAPDELRDTATSLVDEQSSTIDRGNVLVLIMQQLELCLGLLADSCRDGDVHELHRSWNDVCLLSGREISLRQGSRVATGTCLGIDGEGALLIGQNGEVERFFAGTITRLSR